jgi:DNA-binding XRE family transcriptional regulator
MAAALSESAKPASIFVVQLYTNKVQAMPTAPIYSRFGVVLRKHREAAGLSQRQLAAITGHQRTHIGLIEQGTQNPSLTLADDLACALGTSLSKMIIEAQQLSGRGIGGKLKPGQKTRSQ